MVTIWWGWLLIIIVVAWNVGWWLQFWNAAKCWPRNGRGERI